MSPTPHPLPSPAGAKAAAQAAAGRRRSPGPASRQAGLTLVELMLALTLGLFLVAALAYLYTGQRQAWRTLDALARLQENGRFALESLGQNLRMSGYAGCRSTAQGGIAWRGKLSNPAQDTNFRNLLTPFLNGRLVQGFEAWGVDRDLDGSVDAADHAANYLPGTNTLLVAGGGNPVAAVGDVMGSVTDPIPVAANPHIYRQGELVLVADCQGGDLVRVSDNSGNPNAAFTTSLPHDANRNASGSLSRSYGTGALVMPFVLDFYYLRTNPAGRRALYRLPWARDGGWGDAEELVEGVEAMRIVYGEDTNGDGAVDVYRVARDVSDWARVRAVRVSLLLASAEHGLATNPQSYFWDTDNDGELDNQVTAPDRRLYLVFTSTFNLRNR